MKLRYLFAQSDGRIGRTAYFQGLILLVLLAILPLWLKPMLWVVTPLWIWGWVCLTSKRLHDFGRSGPWMMAVLPIAAASFGSAREALFSTPIFMLIALGPSAAFAVAIGLKAGDVGANRFGLPDGAEHMGNG